MYFPSVHEWCDTLLRPDCLSNFSAPLLLAFEESSARDLANAATLDVHIEGSGKHLFLNIILFIFPLSLESFAVCRCDLGIDRTSSYIESLFSPKFLQTSSVAILAEASLPQDILVHM